ncbi:MAG TPA: LPD29 domain-containing protein [bacterium]|nr:LPD29 domain-containing protein [bacterium]
MTNLSTAETAKMLRKALAHQFPGVRFSVRSKVYSGGSSIDVSWTDGPRAKAVEHIARHYEGATFDGMIDLKSYHSTVLVGPEGPREVQMGADFVFTRRTVSDEETRREEAERIIRSRCRIEGDRFGYDRVSDLARGMVYALDFTKGTTFEDTFREIVLREAVA